MCKNFHYLIILIGILITKGYFFFNKLIFSKKKKLIFYSKNIVCIIENDQTAKFKFKIINDLNEQLQISSLNEDDIIIETTDIDVDDTFTKESYFDSKWILTSKYIKNFMIKFQLGDKIFKYSGVEHQASSLKKYKIVLKHRPSNQDNKSTSISKETFDSESNLN